MTALPTLKLPRLPKLGGYPKPPKPPKDYSVDPSNPDKPRISLDDLNKRGADALREHPDFQQEDTRGGVVKVLDVADVQRNVVANAIAKAVGMNTSKLEKATGGAPRVNVSDILGHLGVEPGAVRSIIGFLGDMAIDPLTYETAGASVGLKVARSVPKFIGAGKTAV